MKTTGGQRRDIALSARVRLARNLKDLPFPGRMDADQAEQALARLSKPLLDGGEDGFTLLRLDDGNRLEARALVERHLISPELAGGGQPRGVALSRDGGLSVMIGEEDHLRIQAMGPGLCLTECLREAQRADGLIERQETYAFDEALGYLTACPTNLGTGLRASVMLHLPALTGSGGMRDIVAAAGKMGLAVRGLYGEGTEASGALYQVSNQITLGLSEEEIVSRVSDVTLHIIAREEALRAQYKQRRPREYEDRVWRALGALERARRLSGEEAMKLLSDLRWGVSMGDIALPLETLDTLLPGIQPGVLTLSAARPLRPAERDAARADYVRETLGALARRETK
ncbi:MAG: protein arginine kinase [Oscillospiraceae bacterium]|jgi:protein arginine kinase|nr:protein arginine kinase [Oscillospiraceae bacterium]